MRTCLCILLYSTSIIVFAESTQAFLKELPQRLVGVSGLQGSFRQEKHLAFLQTPFISSGQFTLSRPSGLWWKVVSPLESVMLVQGRNVLLDGKSVQDHGVGNLMAIMMLDLMEGQLTSIIKYFEVTGEMSHADWHLSLKPLSSRLKTAVVKIDLRGDEYLREIVIHEHGDNRTVILLTEVHAISTSKAGADIATPG